MINCFQFYLDFAFKFNLRRYTRVYERAPMQDDMTRLGAVSGRGSHSSTFQLNLSRS
jgi:hypothetical protein